MSTPTMPDFELVKEVVRERHLEQLCDIELVAEPLDTLPIFAAYDDLVQWTKASEAQLTIGKANRVYGGQTRSVLNFNNAFVAFMESAAMYLRDTSQLVAAVKAYSSGNKDEALRLLASSTSQIEDLANLWGMQFIQICDFVTLHPDGHSYLVGPFCGAFIPKDFGGNSPYIGVAFKGTNVREIMNDLVAVSTVRASGWLWGSQVSKGFYYPIFSSYGQTRSRMPFLMIEQAVQDIATKAKTTAVIHVTGHSLGAAYSSLCYAQLCIQGLGTTKASLGDLYTFGAPRVGRGDFAQPLKTAVAPPVGSAWRVVNNKDPVPTVPVSWPWTSDPFIHIDAAYKIYPDKKPAAQPSEIGTHPTLSIPTTFSPHDTTEYYKSLTYATTSKAPAHAVVKWLRHPLALSTPSNISTPTLALSCTPEISLEPTQGCTVGTIKHSCFVGEITALGVVGKLNSSPKFNHNGPESWKQLFAKENQCIFTKKDNKTLEIGFIVDNKQVAVAQVSTESGDIGYVALTRGSCVWAFCEDEKVTDALNHLSATVAGIFE